MRLDNITVSFGDKNVLNNFSYTFDDVGIYVIDAPSGKGKTTLFNVISGILKPDNGKVNLFGKKVTYMFQEDRLFPDFTVLENVSCVTDQSQHSVQRCKELLSELGLKNELNSYPNDLSGGMSRRVALARALAHDGDILLLDEAFKGLDEDTCRAAVETVLKYSKDKLVLIVAHMVDASVFGEHHVIQL